MHRRRRRRTVEMKIWEDWNICRTIASRDQQLLSLFGSLNNTFRRRRGGREALQVLSLSLLCVYIYFYGRTSSSPPRRPVVVVVAAKKGGHHTRRTKANLFSPLTHSVLEAKGWGSSSVFTHSDKQKSPPTKLSWERETLLKNMRPEIPSRLTLVLQFFLSSVASLFFFSFVFFLLGLTL